MNHLVDKSAFEQGRHDQTAAAVIEGLAIENRLATCEVIALELLYSSRGPKDYERLWRRLGSFVWLSVDADVTRMALTLQRRLVRRGQRRRSIADLLIAATALIHDATILHYDKDFDLIAQVTGQPTRWILPRGTGHGQDG